MRVGYNPHKDQPQNKSKYLHQVIVPVYIPNQEGYFKDSFKIFQFCLESLFLTVHNKTFITIVNNGSCSLVIEYLDELFNSNKIHELIHTENIGKLNAILKGLAGNNIELVTISDADVLFLSGWQSETMHIFSKLPKVGVVGLVPQFTLYKSNSCNAIMSNLFNNKLKFYPLKNKSALVRFYDSIGWKRDYNENYLEYTLGFEMTTNSRVYIGSGHFVATYKKDIFDDIVSYIGYKLGGYSEGYLDSMPLNKDYWRVTTEDNFAYHMGNTIEDWMELEVSKQIKNDSEYVEYNFHKQKTISKLNYFIKNKLFNKLLFNKVIHKLFLKWKKLPEEMINNF